MQKHSILEKDELPSRLEETLDKITSLKTSMLMSPQNDTEDVSSDVGNQSFEDKIKFF